jgi:hypothetical protein
MEFNIVFRRIENKAIENYTFGGHSSRLANKSIDWPKGG